MATAVTSVTASMLRRRHRIGRVAAAKTGIRSHECESIRTSGPTAVMTAHDLLFGYGVRCGSGLPLAFAFAFLVGLGSDRRKGLAGVA